MIQPTVVGEKTSGALNLVARYENISQILAGVLGTPYSEAAIDTTGYNQLFVVAATQPSWTIEKFVGTGTPTGKVFTFTGQVMNSLEITIPEKGYVTLAAEFMGATEVSNALGDSPNGSPRPADASLPILAKHATQYLICEGGDTDYCVKSARIKLDRKNNGEDFCVGMATPGQPISDERFEVSGEVEVLLTNRDLYNFFKAGLPGQIAFTFVSATNINVSVKYSLYLSINSVLLEAPGGMPTVDKAGRLTLRLPFKGYGSGGTPGLTTSLPFAAKVYSKFAQAGY
jgi:hypothetical protein